MSKPAMTRNIAAFSALMQKLLERDAGEPSIGVFYGYSGLGKTESASFAALKTGAILTELDAIDSVSSFLRTVLRRMGAKDQKATAADMRDEVVRTLAADITRPLIIDEAHNLASKKQFCDLVKTLTERSGTPIILIGEEMLPKKLQLHERLDNRVLDWVRAEPTNEEDFRLIVKARLPQIAVAPDLATEILQKTRGTTRRIISALAAVRNRCDELGINAINLEQFGAENMPRATAPNARGL